MEALLPQLEVFSVPRDLTDDRFVVSFDSLRSHEEEALQFFKSWGFVVFRNVFSEEECAVSRDAMWSIIEEANAGFSRDDPRTWDEFQAAGKYGLSSRGPCFHPVLVANRQNPRLCGVLASLLETTRDNVMVSHDRFTIYRATQLDTMDGTRFRTGPRNIHLDLNPWWYLENSSDVLIGANSLQYCDSQDFIKENNLVVSGMGPHVQCVLNFCDNIEEDGGTLVVPCFHKHVKSWAAQHSHLRKPVPFVTFGPQADAQRCEAALLQRGQRVPMRQGSVLIWSQTSMHGTEPNDSSSHRMAQFIKAFRRSDVLHPIMCDDKVTPADIAARMARRSKALHSLLQESGAREQVTPLGEAMFGLDLL